MVVALQANSSVSEDEIRDGLTPLLAKFKIPKRVVFVDTLPRNTMGKVEKARRREKQRDIFG